jgi:molecular chaperone DnaK
MLGQFDLVGIPPAPRGVPQIEVTFDIDANGIVNVSAKDKGTGKEQQIRIQASGGLSDSDIEQMVQDAEKFAEDDKKRRAEVEAKNNAESLVHSTETQLKEHGDKVDEALKGEIQAAIDETKSAIESGQTDAITEKSQALAQVAMKLGQAIYEKEQASAASPGADAGGSGEGGEAGGEEVVDAEFSEVDDENKG